MASLFSSKKTHKINYMSASSWRKMFLMASNDLFLSREKFIFDRNSTIPRALTGCKVRIYSGKSFHMRIINRWMVGYKYGEFSWTRKLALYKAKQLKKKKKK